VSRPRGFWEEEERLRKARRAYGHRWFDALRALDTNPETDPDTAASQLERLREEMKWMGAVISMARADLDKRAAAHRRSQKIRQLREGTNGRTEAEVETAHRLADRLEAKPAEPFAQSWYAGP